MVVIVISVIAMGCNEEDSNNSPSAALSLEPNQGWIYDNETSLQEPEITFNASESSDSDGDISNYHYDFGEGNFADQGRDSHERTYTVPGYFRPSLTVQDNDGAEDTVNRILIINYQYNREAQTLEATTGNSDNRSHPFPVSEYHPFSGVINVEIQAAEFESPNANVTVYNAEGEEVAFEQEDNIQEDATIVINLDEDDFDQFGTGEWSVVVAVENGNITYDVTVQIIYNE